MKALDLVQEFLEDKMGNPMNVSTSRDTRPNLYNIYRFKATPWDRDEEFIHYDKHNVYCSSWEGTSGKLIVTTTDEFGEDSGHYAEVDLVNPDSFEKLWKLVNDLEHWDNEI